MGKNTQNQQSQQSADTSKSVVEVTGTDTTQRNGVTENQEQGQQTAVAAAVAEVVGTAQTPSAPVVTTKAGEAAQATEAQRQANQQATQAAKAAETKPAETAIVKNTTSALAGGVSVRESTTDQPLTFLTLPAYQAAVKVANPASQSALGAFAGYLDSMQPAKSQTSASLSRSQATFYNTLMTVLIGETENFAVVWKAIVAGVKLNLKTVFALQMCQRGIDTAPSSVLDENAVRTLTRLIQLLRVEAMVGNTEMLHKQIRVSDAAAALVNRKARENLTRYYSPK